VRRPWAAATRAAASFARTPDSVRRTTSGTTASGAGACGASPGARTMQISPRSPSAAAAASSPRVPRRTSSCSFVSSRQTTAGGDHVRQRVAHPVRALVEDEGAALPGQRLEQAAALAGLPRQEPLEGPPIAGQAGHGQCRHRRRGPGHRGDRQPPACDLLDDPVAGVGHRRHPGIGHEDDGAAGGHGVGQVAGARLLVVVVDAQHLRGRLQVEAVAEGAEAAGVLRGDELRGGDRLAHAGAGVGQVADGGAHEDEPAGGGRVRAAHPVTADARTPTQMSTAKPRMQ
jgi:hypothetical protein